MQLRKWHSIIVCLTLAQTAACAEVVDIDKVTYFCGNLLGDMLSHYCQVFPRRRKRQVNSACCNGLGCSVRYAISNYCQEIKPEYIQLFNKKPKRPNEPIDFSTESTKVLSDTLVASGVKIVQPPDNDSKRSKLLSAIVMAAKQGRETKSASARSKQIINSNPSFSGSFVGTDNVPNGKPVHAIAKDAPFMYPF